MRRTFLIVLLAGLICFAPWPGRAAEPVTYTVGIVPQFDLRRIQSVWRPILDRMEAATGARFTLVLEPDISSFEKKLDAGAYDFAYMNPYHYVVASARQGYRALVRDVAEPLYGIVVVRKDSPLARVEQLDGKIVAFPAPNAMGASLIPRAEFARTFHIAVIPRYVRSHTSSYMNVLMGQAEAAGGIKATFEQQEPAVRDGLRVLYETDRYTSHPLAAHPRVPAAFVESVRSAFEAMGGDDAGIALLAGIPIKTAGPASDRDYDSLRRLGLAEFYVE